MSEDRLLKYRLACAGRRVIVVAFTLHVVVPSPGALSAVLEPPPLVTMPWTTESAMPVPWLVSVVVK